MTFAYPPERVSLVMRSRHVEDCGCAGRAVDLRCVAAYEVAPGPVVVSRELLDNPLPSPIEKMMAEAMRQIRESLVDAMLVRPRASAGLPCPCVATDDYDGERIMKHCAGHCPRVAAGDWSECRGC